MLTKDIEVVYNESALSPVAAGLGDIQEEGVSTPLQCGIKEIEKNHYLRAGKPDLVIVAARPGTGKTAFACQLGLEVARKGNVYMFSLEMTKEQLKTRIMSIESEVPARRLHMLPDDRKLRINKQLGSLGFFIDDTNGISINHLINRALQLHQTKPISLIIVDYLQIVNVTERRTKAEEVGYVTDQLKALAKRISAPVVALAQMNRNVEGRSHYVKDPTPQMSDLADSAQIEKCADMIMFLHKPSMYDVNMPKDLIKVYVAKNRNGESKPFKLRYSGEIYKFFDDNSAENGI